VRATHGKTKSWRRQDVQRSARLQTLRAIKALFDQGMMEAREAIRRSQAVSECRFGRQAKAMAQMNKQTVEAR
jgi:hypothetical protein